MTRFRPMTWTRRDGHAGTSTRARRGVAYRYGRPHDVPDRPIEAPDPDGRRADADRRIDAERRPTAMPTISSASPTGSVDPSVDVAPATRPSRPPRRPDDGERTSTVGRPQQRDDGGRQPDQPGHRAAAYGRDRRGDRRVAGRQRLQPRQHRCRTWSTSCCSAACWRSVLVPFLVRARLRDADRGAGVRAAAADPGRRSFLGGATVLAVLAAPLLTRLFTIGAHRPAAPTCT